MTEMNDIAKTSVEKEEWNGPRLSTLYFYLCGDCNLACRHCWIAPTYQNRTQSDKPLAYDTFADIVDQARSLGLAGVKLTGGEPLIHPEIEKILEVIKSTELTLTIETNGVAVTENLARMIKSCKNPFVSVSIDGLKTTHEWVRRVEGSFDAVCRGTERLVQAGIRPQVIMTIMDKNRNQIEDVVRLAENLGAASVKFNFIQPTERGRQMYEQGEAIPIRDLIHIGTWMETDLRKKSSIHIISSLPMAFRTLSSMFGQETNGTCGRCGIFNILGVLSDGTYALCGIGESVRELTFGKAGDVSLADIWKKAAVLTDIRAGFPANLKGICSRCIMKQRCLGSCIAQNYYRRHDLMAPFWFCDEAEQLGLFPEGRKEIRSLSVNT